MADTSVLFIEIIIEIYDKNNYTVGHDIYSDPDPARLFLEYTPS